MSTSDDYPELGDLIGHMTDDSAADVLAREVVRLRKAVADYEGLLQRPIPMRLVCPRCSVLHIDTGEFAVKPHHTHACQACGEVWRPAVASTVGVQFLPGFKNKE